MFFEIIEYVKELLLELWVEISFIIDLILVFFLNDFLQIFCLNRGGLELGGFFDMQYFMKIEIDVDFGGILLFVILILNLR